MHQQMLVTVLLLTLPNKYHALVSPPSLTVIFKCWQIISESSFKMPHSAFTLSLGHQKISDYNYAITILYFKKLVLSSLLTLSFNNPNKQQQQQPFYGHCCVSWHLQLRAGTDSQNNAKKTTEKCKMVTIFSKCKMQHYCSHIYYNSTMPVRHWYKPNPLQYRLTTGIKELTIHPTPAKTMFLHISQFYHKINHLAS